MGARITGAACISARSGAAWAAELVHRSLVSYSTLGRSTRHFCGAPIIGRPQSWSGNPRGLPLHDKLENSTQRWPYALKLRLSK